MEFNGTNQQLLYVLWLTLSSKQSTSQHFPMEGLPVLSYSATQGRNPKLLWSSNHLMALDGFPTIEPNLLLASALFMKDKPRTCCSG